MFQVDSAFDCNAKFDICPLAFSADCTIFVDVAGMQVLALLDSGSSINLCSIELIEALPPRAVVPVPFHKCLQVRSVNGSISSVVGAYKIELQMGLMWGYKLVYVANGVGKNLILGRQWLHNNGACSYFPKGVLYVNGSFVCW